jgi:hypothetical protein
MRKDLQPDDGDEFRSNIGAMSLAEKMMRWGIDEIPEDSSPHQSPPLESREDEDEGDEGDDDDDQPFIPVEYEGLRAFLLESDEFKLLFHNLELGLHGKEVDTWLYVRTRIVKELASFTMQSNRPPANYSLAIDLPWMPRRFLNEQYNHLQGIPELGSVITLSGATENVYAATAEAYIRRTWPRYGPLVLAMLQEALVSSEDWYCSNNTNDFSLQIWLRDDSTTAFLSGPPLFIAGAAEVLVWLSIACRASTTPDTIQSCHVHLVPATHGGADLSFKAELKTIENPQEERSPEAVCWHGMFRNPVIAHQYPIPTRKPQEKGLELSLDLMLSLARTFWAAIYDGLLMLKGFNTLLIPTLKLDGSIIWHFTVDRSGGRLSYNDGEGSSCIDSFGDALLDGTRHFVGWTNCANYLVGKLICLWDIGRGYVILAQVLKDAEGGTPRTTVSAFSSLS